MSIYAAQGKIYIECSMRVEAEDYVSRMHSIITLIQNQEEMDKDATYHGLELLREMLPGIHQAKHFLKFPFQDDVEFRG